MELWTKTLKLLPSSNLFFKYTLVPSLRRRYLSTRNFLNWRDGGCLRQLPPPMPRNLPHPSQFLISFSAIFSNPMGTRFRHSLGLEAVRCRFRIHWVRDSDQTLLTQLLPIASFKSIMTESPGPVPSKPIRTGYVIKKKMSRVQPKSRRRSTHHARPTYKQNHHGLRRSSS